MYVHMHVYKYIYIYNIYIAEDAIWLDTQIWLLVSERCIFLVGAFEDNRWMK